MKLSKKTSYPIFCNSVEISYDFPSPNIPPLTSFLGHNGHQEDERLQEKVNELETKIKAQDLEIHLLKCTLADTLSRLSNLENTKGEPRANLKKAVPEKTPSSQSHNRKTQSVPQMSPVKSAFDGKNKPEKVFLYLQPVAVFISSFKSKTVIKLSIFSHVMSSYTIMYLRF